MKRFSNPTHEMKAVHFSDGSTQFLMRGQSFETEKDVKKYDDGLRVTSVAKKETKKSEADSQE